MQEDYGGYARRRKKPGKGRYPMGPTNIDRVDIGSCVWYPTFLVDTVSKFLNGYYQKLSENVWVGGSGASRSGDVTMGGQRATKQKGKIELLSH